MTARVLFSWPPEPASNHSPMISRSLSRKLSTPLLASSSSRAKGVIPQEVPPHCVALFPRAGLSSFGSLCMPANGGWTAASESGRPRLPAHVLRLAGTLCFLDWAFVGGSEPAAIDDPCMEAAVLLVRDYFWPHARACLRQIGLSDHHKDARRVLRWIRSAAASEISVKNVRRDALAGSLDATQTETLLNNLAAAGWLRRLREPSRPQGGRPVLRWIVNPAIHAAPDQA